MGRLSLAIGRHKNHAGDERPSKSRHFRSSLKGLLGIPSGDRASIDLGDLDELPEEHAHAPKLPPANPADPPLIAAAAAPAVVDDSDDSANASEPRQLDSDAVAEDVSSQSPEGPVAGIESLTGDNAPLPAAALEQSHSQAEPDAVPAAATTAVHASAENAAVASAAPLDDISSEQAALARYSMVVDQDQAGSAAAKGDDDHDGDDKHSWRRRGSLLTSRLAAPLRSSSSKDGASLSSGRLVMRKESTPLFSSSSPHKAHHHLFHRSESGDAANKGSSFWRSGSALRTSVHAGDSAVPSTSSDIASAAAAAAAADTAVASPPPERTHRSSSVPFLVPIPASAHPGSANPMASPYLCAINSGIGNNHSRLNRKDLTMSLSGSRRAQDRLPKLSLAGSLDACSPPGSPSPVSLTLLNDKAAAAGGASATPMTFLVSPRPRASTGTRHGIPGVTSALSRVSTHSREFKLDKRTLSSATIPALDTNAPASPRALSGGVDVSDFGVAASSIRPASVASAKHLALLPPSPVSTSTPARSIASTSASAAFEPLHEEAEDGASQACANQPSSLSQQPLSGRRQDDSAARSTDAVHETHHMEVLHDPHTGRKMINQYMIIRELGRGTHGKVKLAFDTITGDYYAIKVIDKESRDRRLRFNNTSAQRATHRGAAGSRRRSCHQRASSHGFLRIDIDKMERVKREIAILKKCRHPNVVRLREVIDDAHARRIYLVIEFMDQGEISWRDASNLPVMTADEARSVFRDLVLGVEYLHYAGILHRDLKPQNLLHNKAGTVKISDFGVSFLSRRMSKHQLRSEEASIREEAERQRGADAHDTGATVTPHSKAHGKQLPQPQPPLSALHGAGFTPRTRTGADAKAPSPLRPAGRSAAVQGSPLHRYASQPVMGSGSSRIQPGPVLQRKGSVMSRSSKYLASSGSSEASLHSQYSRQFTRQSSREVIDPTLGPSSQWVQQQATMGMTDEFGRRKASLPVSRRPYIESPLSSPLGASAAVPELKLPPEITSTDLNIYDPFDSSDSDEFFPHSSTESESDYGNQYARDDNDDDDDDDDDSDSEEGIVFGALPAKPAAQVESPQVESPQIESPQIESPQLGDDASARADSTSGNRPQHQRKGTLGDINASFDEKDEERELAKTAGTPAFFAPELCCTAEELAKVLKDERARRQAHMRLISRNRHCTEPMLSAPATRACATTQVVDAEQENSSRRGSSLRPTSMFVEKSPSNVAAAHAALNGGGSAAASATPLGVGGPAKSMKRHSTIASLLARPFSPKPSKSRSSAASGSTPGPALSLEDVDDELADQPLPANLITPAIDIWAMGVTLYCLIYGRVPFQASTEFELFNIIPRQPLEFPQYLEAIEDSSDPLLLDVQCGTLDEASAAARPVRKVPLPPPDADLCDLLSRLLDKDFRTRITIEELKQHPWVVRDLDHPSDWAQETDPTLRPSLMITSQEVEQAVVPKVHSQRGFRASVRRRISMLSPLASKGQQSPGTGDGNGGARRQQRLRGAATKAKSSLDWLKIWQ